MAKAPPPSRCSGIAASIAKDGSEIGFEFVRTDGSKFEISVSLNTLADFIFGLEAQAGSALASAHKASGGDRRFMMPVKKRKVTKIQGATVQGQPILSLEVDGRIPLDMVLSRDQIPKLIEYLQDLQKAATGSPPKPN